MKVKLNTEAAEAITVPDEFTLQVVQQVDGDEPWSFIDLEAPIPLPLYSEPVAAVVQHHKEDGSCVVAVLPCINDKEQGWAVYGSGRYLFESDPEKGSRIGVAYEKGKAFDLRSFLATYMDAELVTD